MQNGGTQYYGGKIASVELHSQQRASVNNG